MQHENVAAADMFLEFYGNFAIGEAADIGATEVDIELFSNVGSQLGVGVAGEDHQAVVGHFHIPPDISMRSAFGRYNENRAGF